MDFAAFAHRHADEIGSLAMLLVAVAVSAALWRAWPFFRTIVTRGDAEVHGGRAHNDALDGLRGLLCLFVFIHHAAVTIHLQRAYQPWDTRADLAPAAFMPRGVSVGMFFALTALLLYRRVLDRPAGPVGARKFFIRRVARLAPMLFVSIALMIAADFAGPRMLSWRHLEQLALKAASIGALGTSKFFQNACVFWTLRYEWAFYLAFPLLALAAARGVPAWARLLGALAVAIACWRVSENGGLLLTYVAGLAAAHACAWPGVRRLAGGVLGSALVLIVAWSIQGVAPNPASPRSFYLIVAGAVFAGLTLMAAGADVFGLLRLPAIRALGTVSYGVYLLHGIALFMLRPVIVHHPGGPLAQWAMACGATVVVVLLAFVGYRWVEHPGIALGRRLTRPRPAAAGDPTIAPPAAIAEPMPALARQ